MKNSWPQLKYPPIILALVQMKYHKEDIKLENFHPFDEKIKKRLPSLVKNIHTNINVHGSPVLGVSKLNATSKAEVTSYTYLSEDQKTKLTIACDTITYQDEHQYSSWENLKNEIKYYLDIFREILDQSVINRLSIRFINKFDFDDFEDPTMYFNTLVSSSNETGFPFPLLKYGFRLMLTVPDSNIYSIVNQNLESENKYHYIFDIDVLDKQNIVFEVATILTNLEALRQIKNQIFFSNVTQKVIELCNSEK